MNNQHIRLENNKTVDIKLISTHLFSICIKGEENDEAVLCTPKETYAIKQVRAYYI